MLNARFINIFPIFLIFIFTCSFSTFHHLAVKNDQLKSVKIGDMEWTSKNLNIPVDGSWCINCEKYGRLYSFNAAKAVANKIPGWRLPTQQDWQKLEKILGVKDHEQLMAYKSRGNSLREKLKIENFPGYLDNKQLKYQDTVIYFWSNSIMQMDQGAIIENGIRKPVDDLDVVTLRGLFKTGSNKNNIYECVVPKNTQRAYSVRLVKNKTNPH